MTYQMNEKQLNDAVSKMYQKQIVGAGGVVGMTETVHDDRFRNPTKTNPNGYFARLAGMANQVDSERIARHAVKRGFEPVDLLMLAKLEMIFSKPENQDTISAIEYRAMKSEFQRRYGKRPDMNQVRSMVKEQKTNRIKCLEKLIL